MPPSSKVLVLGGTGPSGICLLRELVHRSHAAVVYVRNPSKIPSDLASHPLLEIVHGEMSNVVALSSAMTNCSIVLSLLGPDLNNRNIDPTLYADCYKSLFPVMRQHSIRRIVAMGTLSIQRPEDRWTILQPMARVFMRLFAGAIYRNMQNLATLFDQAQDLDWTVFRITQITGESNEASWKRDREDGEVFTGPIGGEGWTSATKRALLARWLVDVVESGTKKWVHQMPAVSQLAGTGAS